MRISDWSSDVCSSDLKCGVRIRPHHVSGTGVAAGFDQSFVSARDLVDPRRVPSAPILRFRAQSYHLKKILQVLSIFDFMLDGTISRSVPSRSEAPQTSRATCRDRVCTYV